MSGFILDRDARIKDITDGDIGKNPTIKNEVRAIMDVVGEVWR